MDEKKVPVAEFIGYSIEKLVELEMMKNIRPLEERCVTVDVEAIEVDENNTK